jgi:hypothetical protein
MCRAERARYCMQSRRMFGAFLALAWREGKGREGRGVLDCSGLGERFGRGREPSTIDVWGPGGHGPWVLTRVFAQSLLDSAELWSADICRRTALPCPALPCHGRRQVVHRLHALGPLPLPSGREEGRTARRGSSAQLLACGAYGAAESVELHAASGVPSQPSRPTDLEAVCGWRMARTTMSGIHAE